MITCQVEGWNKGQYKKFKKCESDSSSEDETDNETECIKPIKIKSKIYTKIALIEDIDSE